MRKLILRLVFAAYSLCFLSVMVSAAEPNPLADTIEKVKPAIVAIGTYQKTRRPPAVFRGTGFVLANGLLVATNAHVLPEKIDVEKREFIAVFSGAGSVLDIREATNVAEDRDHDLVLLRITGRPLTALSLGDSSRVREGEPYAFTAACQVRVDAGGHQLFNFALAGVDELPWTIDNTEPALRLEFRIPEPSIAFSLSAFYTHQDTPVAKFSNFYSTDNPNAAAMLFLQGLYDGGSVANTIEFLAGETPGTTVWTTGFDPYDRSPAGTLFEANDILITAYQNVMTVGPCAGLGGQTQVDCASQFAAFVLPWAASEATLKYPRIWALGASADYQIPGIDTVLRIEMAADLNRHITNTALRDMDDKSPVFQMAVGLDRSTFIPFLNRNRTAFLSFQTFLEHIVDYDDGPGRNDGMVAYETSVISTAFMQNYWRNDSIILTNFAAVDWMAGAVIMGPSLRYVYDDHWFFDVGMNVLWGKRRDHNLSDMCADQSYSCLTDPTSWTPGQWQTLNSRFQQAAEAPFWGLESFSDKFMRNRDEFWFGVTYQF